MAKKRVARRGRTVKVAKRQTGRTHRAADKRVSALKPGRRISRTGKRYTETRANRSDKNPRKRL